MADMILQSPGTPGQVAIGRLRLDPNNPRIPEGHRGGSDVELAQLLEMGYEAHSIAQSIAELGYFAAEPLIVVPGDEEGTWIVVEGNRRLTALLGLADPVVRAGFAAPEKWNLLAEKCSIDLRQEVPVVAHSTRETTHAEIARVHVVGKLPWRPYMQARYIAARVSEGRSIQEVADLIGIPKSKAADLYRDQAVLAQAAELGMETSQVEAAFSLLTVALGSTKIRNHVGAPLGSQTAVGSKPIPVERTRELGEVIQWIFGDEDHEPVIADSREISKLGNVLSSETGLRALRQGMTLAEAKQQMESVGLDPLTSIIKRLNAGRSSLESVAGDITEHAANAQVRALVDDVESIVGSIRSTLDEMVAEDTVP